MKKASKKRQSFNYRALSAEIEVERAPFESTKIVLVLFAGVVPTNFINVD